MPLVPHFIQKFLGFGPLFCKMELNTMQNFWKKVFILHFGFWSQEAKKKSQKALTHPMKNLAFLDGTKHTHKNFGILYFFIPNSWHFAFCIPWGTKLENKPSSSFPPPPSPSFSQDKIRIFSSFRITLYD
jgi:hypothetical protein